MNRYEVYHRIHPAYFLSPTMEADLLQQLVHGIKAAPKEVGKSPGEVEGYLKVAEVEAEDLETVFRLTNSIDRPWWERAPQVRLICSPPLRSTSVSDLIILGERAWLVCPVGFAEVPTNGPEDINEP